MRKRTIVASSAAVLMAAGISAGVSASSASANNYPVPTVTPTVTPTFPVINPFANCRFTFTRDTTFVPQIGQFRTQFVPAIACVGRFGNVRVYDLVR